MIETISGYDLYSRLKKTRTKRIGLVTVYHMMQSGVIETVVVDGQRRIPTDVADKFIKERNSR